MSRTERIHKLCNAIRTYRGSYNATSGKWLRAPQPILRGRILTHLRSLNLHVTGCMNRIDAFKTVAEFDAWIKTISQEVAP